MLGKRIKLRKDIITRDHDNYPIQNWVGARLINIGDVPVEIDGLTYAVKESIDLSVAHLPVVYDLSIKFNNTAGTKKVVAYYGVYTNDCD